VKLSLKISALLSALALGGCVVPPQEQASPVPAQQGSVQVECGVASPPGCREPAVFVDWEQKLNAETTAVDELRQRAVEAMSQLPASQRIIRSETVTTEQAFQSRQVAGTRNMKVLDSVAIDLPWAAKSKQEHKDAMTAIKDIATLMADNRGSATIYVTVSPRDLRSKKVNLKSGTAPTEAGNPVEVKKSADKNVQPGVEHFVIQAKPWGGTIE
jgi:hypothetical protein